MFTSIYGCGSVSANRMYESGFRTIESLRSNHENLSKKLHTDLVRLKYGLTYYDDLSVKKIDREEG